MAVSTTNIRFRGTGGIENEFGDVDGNPAALGQAYMSGFYRGMTIDTSSDTTGVGFSADTLPSIDSISGGHHFVLEFDPSDSNQFDLLDGVQNSYNKKYKSKAVSTRLGSSSTQFFLNETFSQGKAYGVQSVALFFTVSTGNQHTLSHTETKAAATGTRIFLVQNFNDESVSVQVRNTSESVISTTTIPANGSVEITVASNLGLRLAADYVSNVRAHNTSPVDVYPLGDGEPVRTVNAPAGKTVYVTLGSLEGVRGSPLVRLTLSNTGSELQHFGANEIDQFGDHRGTFFRNRLTNPKVYYISKTLADVVIFGGVVKLYYWLGYAKAGLDNILSLPGVDYYTNLPASKYEDNIARDVIFRSEEIVRKANIPYSNPDTFDPELSALNQKKGAYTRGGLNNGVFGTRNIPRYHEGGEEIKLSNFSGATKKPEHWEVFSHFYNMGFGDITHNQQSRMTNSPNPYYLKFLRKFFVYQARAGGDGGSIQSSSSTPVSAVRINSSTSSYRGGDYQYDISIADKFGSSTPTQVTNTAGTVVVPAGFLGGNEYVREKYNGFEWTTLLFQHAAIGIENADTDDFYISYNGGNLGKNSSVYHLVTQKKSPTIINPLFQKIEALSGFYSSSDGAGSNSSKNDYLTEYSTGPDYDSSGDNTSTATSKWYYLHINLPISEISKIRVKTKHAQLSKRHSVLDLHILPGKFAPVAGSFKQSTRTTPEPGAPSPINGSAAHLSSLEHLSQCDQSVYNQQLVIFSGFSDYRNGVVINLTDGTTVRAEDITLFQGSDSETTHAGGCQTRIYAIADKTNPDSTGSAGTMKASILKSGVSTYIDYSNNNSYREQHSLSMQSFRMELLDT